MGRHWGEYGINLTFLHCEERSSCFVSMLALESPADVVEGEGVIWRELVLGPQEGWSHARNRGLLQDQGGLTTGLDLNLLCRYVPCCYSGLPAVLSWLNNSLKPLQPRGL